MGAMLSDAKVIRTYFVQVRDRHQLAFFKSHVLIIFYILQGSVTTHLRCGEMFNYYFSGHLLLSPL